MIKHNNKIVGTRVIDNQVICTISGYIININRTHIILYDISETTESWCIIPIKDIPPDFIYLYNYISFEYFNDIAAQGNSIYIENKNIKNMKLLPYYDDLTIEDKNLLDSMNNIKDEDIYKNIQEINIYRDMSNDSYSIYSRKLK